MLQKYTKYPKNAIYGLVAQNLTAAEVTNIAKKATIVLHPGQTLRFLMNGFFWDYGNNSGSLKVSRSGVSLVFVDPIKAVTLKPKLQPADLPRNSHFGYSVAISSNWAIVGAHAAGALCQANAGAAYLFQCEGGVSQPKPKLQPADLPRNSHFGYSVAISSNWAIVGAHAAGALCQANEGAAYLFQCEGGVSQPKPKLQPADLPRNSHFGYSVAISSNWAIVGAHAAGALCQANARAAYFFPAEV